MKDIYYTTKTGRSMDKKQLKELLTFPTSDAHVERVLGLPFRTISRIRSTGRTSAVTIALLKVIKIYPWLLDVADAGFDEMASKKIMCHSAIDAMFPEKR